MTWPTDNDVRCEALFASGLQQSEAPSASSVEESISRALFRLGTQGCTDRMAQEFGDHPEAAAVRMHWARTVTGEVFGRPRLQAYPRAS